MTDTIKPPSRPKSPRAGRPPEQGGDRPRQRPPATRASDAQRPGEPAPREDDARIAKVMARAGLCSRRDAESWIAAGRVAVNGKVIDSPALNVRAQDRITVDGAALPEREPTRLFMFHKPRGLVTTSRDPEGRPTIFENLPPGLPRVVSVGRLDINTEGLMLLTNDGGLARVLELPATGWMRRYRVRANGEIDQARLDALKAGVTVDGVDYAGIEATLDRIQGSNAWLTMGLREGKNREIKRVLESLGLAVTRLIRVSFGPFHLGELAEGAVEAVPSRVLRDQLGAALMAEAGMDLGAPEEPPRTQRGRTPSEPRGTARPGRAPALTGAHVSVRRAARDEVVQEGRQRIERGATADRRGRTVKIERVVPVRPGGAKPEGATRNARRFAQEKRDNAAGRSRSGADAPRGGAKDRPRMGGSRTKDVGDRPAPSRGQGNEARVRPRTPRDPGGFDGAPRPHRGGASPAPTPRARDAGHFPGGRATADRRADRPDGISDRAGGFGGRPVRPRGGSDDAGRADPRWRRDGGGFGDEPRGRKPGSSAGAPQAERANSRSAGGEKRGGRPGGFGTDRPATGRNRSGDGGKGSAGGTRPTGGSRPGGGRPSSGGGRPPRGRP